MAGRVVPKADGQGFETASAFVSVDPVSGKPFGKGGENGVMVTTNTTPVTGTFTAVQILEDTVFSAFTETGTLPGSQPMTGFTVYAGQTLFGRITAYTLTSGKVRAYA